MASPRERAASIATARFSLTFLWPMNSASRCGRSFSSNEESSSTGAADTRRSRLGLRLGLFFAVATASDGRTKREPTVTMPLLCRRPPRPGLYRPLPRSAPAPVTAPKRLGYFASEVAGGSGVLKDLHVEYRPQQQRHRLVQLERRRQQLSLDSAPQD